MSKVKIQGNPNGTGALTIAAPNTNTDRTLTLPDQTGTLVSTDASGNVGIGTNTPAAPLDVLTNASALGIAIRGRSDNISNIAFQSNNGATNYGQIQGRSTDLRIQGVGLPITFFGTSSEFGRFDTSGNLLVGKTSTATNVAGVQIYVGTGGQVTLSKTASGSADALACYHSGTYVGGVVYSNTATSFPTASDYRLKEDAQPMIGALEKVSKLKPVTYKWKSDGSNGQGFIAHELQQICPDAVVGEKDAVDADGNPVYQGIDTSFLVATLTAAIQEQQAIIEQLTARINALEAK